jgi:integrase
MTSNLVLNTPGKGQSNSMVLALSLPQERIVEASNLAALIDAYIAEKQTTIDPTALRTYRANLRPFIEWWRVCPDQHGYVLSRSILRKFVDWLTAEYRSSVGNPASDYMIEKCLVLVRRVLRWAHQVGAVSQDISELVPMYTAPEQEKYYPSTAELGAVMEVCSGDTKVRDMALWAFLIATGARRMEVAAATVDNLYFATSLDNLAVGDDHSGYVHFRVVKGDNLGRGLGRDSLFCSKAGLLLKVWMRLCERTEGSVFGLTDDGIRFVVNTTGRAAQIDRMHPHACRSAFVSWWLDKNAKGGPVADVALRMQVGHKPVTGDAQAYYRNKNPDYRRRLISNFYTSPLEEITIDWRRLPVHIAR